MKRAMEPMNRTGAMLKPEDTAELTSVTEMTPPSSPGDARAIAAMRQAYSMEGDLVGHVPPPVDKASRKKTMSARSMTLMDKLGERLAFERSGVRLYEALLAKYDVAPPIGPGKQSAMRTRIAEILAEEHQHFLMLVEAITALGGDPTALTPCANVAAVASSGIPKVLLDPRTTFTQCLDAILVAELTDNDGWMLLAELTEAEGHRELAQRFREAEAREGEHLATVREWLSTAVLTTSRAKGEA